MISKELLSEVLGEGCGADGNIQIASTTVHYSKVTHMAEINIYELAHKCKEWASKNNYVIKEHFIHKETTIQLFHINNNIGIADYKSVANTEPEAIFKACEWILDNKHTT